MVLDHFNIIGTRHWVLCAWEPYAGHSTFTYQENAQLGRIGTCALPAALDALTPYSMERAHRVTCWQEAQYQEAYAKLRPLVPERAEHVRESMGEISYFLPA